MQGFLILLHCFADTKTEAQKVLLLALGTQKGTESECIPWGLAQATLMW